MECRGEEGVVFVGVAFRELPGGRSRWRLPQSLDRAQQRSTHCGYCVHGAHLLPIDDVRHDGSSPQGTLQLAMPDSRHPERSRDRHA